MNAKFCQLKNKIKNRTSSRKDGISNKLLKPIKSEISETIAIISNQSILTGIFPDQLKLAKVKPLTDRNCNVSEDFPREIAYRRRKLFPVFSKARKTPGINKKSISLKADILIINGKKYTVDTLDQLKDNRVVFGGIYSNFHPLSNYYSCPITFRKQRYRSLEQAYQHCKALFFGQAESASKIMTSRDPAEAKRISYEINGPRDLQSKWDEQRIDLMTSL